jgi:hypothetical protein
MAMAWPRAAQRGFEENLQHKLKKKKAGLKKLPC